MATPSLSPPPLSQTTCGSLLQELQKIWDAIGENDNDRDKMLFQLEQECLDIYKRKVEETRKSKADFDKVLAEAEAEFSILASSLGEHISFSREKGTLKEQISAMKPALDELRAKKQERVKEISEILLQINHISSEITGSENSEEAVTLYKPDLSVKLIGELKSRLQDLQNEKSLRLQKVNNYLKLIQELSVVLAINFAETVTDVHPSLSTQGEVHSKSISNETLAKLTGVIYSLKQEKLVRLQKLQSLGSMLLELWNLMDIPAEERCKFNHVVLLTSSSVDDVNGMECLAQNVIEQAEMEVERLNILKASKIKELVLKRQETLEEIYRSVHMEVDTETKRQTLISLIEAGVDISDLLASMESQIDKAKEEASSRKEILDKLEKWRFASAEEHWLEDYEQDDNRFASGRGAHKNLKRAEKARVLVSKIPSMVENITAKVKAWEADKGIPFLYDKEPVLKSLEDYKVSRNYREEEKRRARDQKRLQEQMATEKEAMFGSKPSIKRPLGLSSNNGNTILGTPVSRRLATPGRFGVSTGKKERRESVRTAAVTPINYVALAKDDSASKGH